MTAMVSPSSKPSTRRALVGAATATGLACLVALAGCSSEDRPKGARDAGSTNKDEPDAGKPPSLIASATAELEPVAAGADSGASDSVPVMGKASWRMTATSVDLDVAFGGCIGLRPFPIEILEATDCSDESLKAPVWGSGRGSGIPGVLCTGAHSGRGLLAHARDSARQDAWTIGGPEASDLTGHSVVVRHPLTGEPLACGVIAREQDAIKVELPAADASPRAEVRGLLTGLCQFRLFPNTGPSCPDVAALVECADLHCDVGACLQTCQDYASCLDGMSGDACASAASCPLTAECSQCQNDLASCMYGFCPEHVTCSPAITPDGPCNKLEGCCALQGKNADTCLSTIQTIVTFGGDANCVGSMNDWDVLAHLHVPCKFQQQQLHPPEAPDATAPDESRLAAGTAGRACSGDDDCPGGRCSPLPEAQQAGAESSYCTLACDSTSQCGAGGACVAVADAEDAKQCLAVCGVQSDCREGFVCAGAGRAGRISIQGSCRPKRAVNQLADQIAGRACDDDAQCSGGHCSGTNLLGTSYPGNYCTGRCYEDDQCGEGGVCWWALGSLDPGYCLERCAQHADCERDGYRCWELGDGARTFHACYPGSQPILTTGDPCSDDATCGEAPARCASELPFGGLATNEVTAAAEGYCTQGCSLDEECGSGSTCVNYGTSGGICLVHCSDDSTCRDGYVCIAHLRDGDPEAKVCVPEG
jgi:hypothetical protein